MRRKKDKDEFLEQLWYMKEKAISSIDSLKHMMENILMITYLMNTYLMN